jgi:peptide/nickel transport system permease protein
LIGILVLFIVIVFVFTLPYWQPQGIMHEVYLLCNTHATKACIDGTARKYGLNHPYLVRLWDYIWALLHGNLGLSIHYSPPQVTQQLAYLIPRTFWIAFFSLVFAVIIALPIGVYQAWRRNSTTDYIATGVLFILYSTPVFVFGYMLQDIFALHDWMGFKLPLFAPYGVDAWSIFKQPQYFILPVGALTALSLAGLSRFMRSQVLDVLVQDYVRTARAKGCSTRQILFRHTMRNALGPIITIIGLSIPGLISGAFIVESVFNYQGLGLTTLQAAVADDLNMVLGATLLVTVLTVLGNLIADVSLVVVNPRIRIEGKAR